MRTSTKIGICLLLLLVFVSHAFFPIVSILGYKMPMGVGLIGMLGTLAAILIGIGWTICAEPEL